MNQVEHFWGTSRLLLKLAAWAVIILAIFLEIRYVYTSNALYGLMIGAAPIWLIFIEPMLDTPYIYVVKETGLFVYAKGSQRIAFDFVTLLKGENNDGLLGGINQLRIAKPTLSGGNSYLVFDHNNSAIAVLPHQTWYSDNQVDAKIVLVNVDGSKTRISIGDFMQQQAHILREAKAASAK